MNIAEILKYCPKGTKLYSTIFGNVKLQKVLDEKIIEVTLSCGAIERFFKDGLYTDDGECVLFPSKDQRNWNQFRLPVKRGDIMMEADGTMPFIASGEYYWNTSPKYICGIDGTGHFNIGTYGWTSEFYIPASEEAKKELFDKIAGAGYRWNAETLELEKIELKSIDYEFKPFDKVLVRDAETKPWKLDIFSHYMGKDPYKYHCVGDYYRYCIPYEGNEYLLGTTNSPS